MTDIKELHVTTRDCDERWVKEEDLPSLDEEELAWWKNEFGLSLEDLYRLFTRAREIVQPTDDILYLTYDAGGGWYVSFTRSDPEGRWGAHIWRPDDPTMARQPAKYD